MFCWKFAARAGALLLGCVVYNAFGQPAAQPTLALIDIEGVVHDSATHASVEGVMVVLVQSKRIAYTDVKGMFQFLHVPPGPTTLVFRLVGYREYRLDVDPTESVHLRIQIVSESLEMSMVIIRGEKAPSSITESNHAVERLNSATLEKIRGQSLGKILENVPGITLLQTGPSISKPIIRGLHSQRILILNSGVPLEGQQWGGEHAPEIDPFAASEIVVLKGAAGVEYGAGAIGGVIRLQPKPMPDHFGLDGDLTLNGFANNRQGAGALSLEWMGESLPGFSVRLQGSGRKAGNTSTPTYTIGNTGFQEENGSATIGYNADAFDVRAIFTHFQTELGIYKGSHIGSIADLQRALQNGRPTVDYPFTYDIIPPKQNISHDTWSVLTSTALPNIGRLELQYGWQSNHRQEYDAFRFFNNVQQLPTQAAFDLVLTTYTAELRLRHEPVEGFYGTIGASAMRQGNVGAGSSFLIPNYRLYSGGLFWVEAWTGDRLTLNVGVRYDYRWLHVYPFDPKKIEDQTLQYNNFSGATGFTWKLTPGWSLAGNLGSAFRPPSVNELFSDGVHHGSAQYEKGDPNLQSERSYSVDLTGTYRVEEDEVTVSSYVNFMNGFIFLLPSPTPVLTLRGAFPFFQYRQANSVLRGFDGSASTLLVDHIRVGASVSVVRGDNLETNEPLFLMPADRLRLTVKYELAEGDSYRDAYVELTSMVVARQTRFPQGVDYTNPPGGYTLWSVAAGSEVALGGQHVRCHVHVTNMFDKSYRDYLSRFRYFIDEPGRDIELKFEIPFFLYH